MSHFANYIKERQNKEIIEDESGFATYYFIMPDCYIEDIYVIPEKRKAGIAAKYADKIAKIAQEKNCLKSNYGKDLYVEEDFADLFSSHVVNKMTSGSSSSVKKTNMSCGFPSFKTLEMDELQLENDYAQDPHSSDLYRLLSVATSLNNLTSECSSYLQTYRSEKTSLFTNYCKIKE